MNRDEMLEYFKLYTEDFEKAVERYYTEDIVFANPDNVFNGRQAILEHFRIVRDGIKEIFTPLNIVMEGDKIAAELDIELLATRDKPDFAAGPLKEGESIHRTVGAFYHLRDNKICRVNVYRSGDRPS